MYHDKSIVEKGSLQRGPVEPPAVAGWAQPVVVASVEKRSPQDREQCYSLSVYFLFWRPLTSELGLQWDAVQTLSHLREIRERV